MTPRRDDMNRAAVASLLDDLRGELLVMPREQVVEDHLEMMAFERQVLATPRFVRPSRSSLAKPRRTAFVIACVCTTIASCGLSAAGALPEPLQHITDSIARTLGVPQPHATPEPTHSVGAGPTPGTRPAPAVEHVTPPAPASAHAAAVPNKVKPAHAHRPATAGPAASGPKAPALQPPLDNPRPTHPSPRIKPRKHHHAPPPPSRNSDNTPPGYPTKWRNLAIDAATAHLQECSLTATLAPSDCPQVATAAGASAQVESVSWTLLNDPQAGASAVAQTKFGHTTSGAPTTATTVTVYERFQMDAQYTEAGDPARTYLAYSGGIAQATMTWNGSSFDHVSFRSGSVVGDLLKGVTVPLVERPAAVTDAAALAAVLAGFNDCAAIGSPAADPLPSCGPNASATGPWNLVGDPTQGAVVTFDPQLGLFTVTGSYAMTGAPDAAGNPVHASGPYTATLFFDGLWVRLLSISAPATP